MRIDFMVSLACEPKRALANPGLLPLLRQNDPRVSAHAAHCSACPASRNGERFSCWGAIGFPIEFATEEWLSDRLDDDPDSVGISSLEKLCEGHDGAPIQALRARGAFERREAYTVEWESDEDTLTMTTDEILHTMLFSGPQPPSALFVYALAFGIIPADAPDKLVARSLTDLAARRKLLGSIPNPPPPPTQQTMAFLLLFGAMVRALWLDVPLVIEVS